jgi:hypothetical protein
MTTFFQKQGFPHIAIITETKYGYKCQGYDFSYRNFPTYSSAFSYMKKLGYKVRTK